MDRTGGWASVFGDGMTVQIDLCQRCVGPWLRVDKGPIILQIDALVDLGQQVTDRGDKEAP